VTGGLNLISHQDLCLNGKRMRWWRGSIILRSKSREKEDG
jgi:hypothetical protein